MVLSIDYLIINCEIDAKIPQLAALNNTAWTFSKLEYGTKKFQSIEEVYLNGKMFGTIVRQPYKGSVLPDNFAQLQLNNEVLYENPNLLKQDLEILEMHLGKFTGISRVDLALDGSGFDFNEILFSIDHVLAFSDVILTGKEKKVTKHTTSKGNLSGFSVGSRASEKYFRFYDKTTHLEKEPKPWIRRRHKEFIELETPTEKIWRLEVQLNRPYVKHISNVYSLFSHQYQLGLFLTALNQGLDFRQDTGQKVLSRNPKIELFDIAKLDRWKRRHETDVKRFFPESKNPSQEMPIQKAKREMKRMFIRYAENPFIEAPLFIFTEILKTNEDNLLEFFYKKRDQWLFQCHVTNFDYQKFWNLIDEISENFGF